MLWALSTSQLAGNPQCDHRCRYGNPDGNRDRVKKETQDLAYDRLSKVPAGIKNSAKSVIFDIPLVFQVLESHFKAVFETTELDNFVWKIFSPDRCGGVFIKINIDQPLRIYLSFLSFPSKRIA